MIQQFIAQYGAIILALCASFILGGFCVWLKLRHAGQQKQGLDSEYIKGFNYLVNDQSDKAVEVFVKALEVDSETVELHLALGGLFRREGQVGRATRIHQNIIARPYLTDEQNRLAVFELARDYFKAGLFDRAESLFLELIDRKAYVESSLLSLLSIYESEKEWHKAIDIAKKIPIRELPDARNRICHYWCEIAENYLIEAKFADVKHALKQAKSNNSESRRVVFLQGKLLLEQGNVSEAMKAWQTLLEYHDHYSDWVSEIMCQNVSMIGTKDESIEFLRKQLKQHCSVITAEKYLELTEKHTTSWSYILECIAVNPSKALIYWLMKNLSDSRLVSAIQSYPQIMTLVYSGLTESVNNYNSRKCDDCGFESNQLNWQCPSCKRWDTQNRNN